MPLSDGYLVPSNTARVESIVVNSRFITTVGYVDSTERAKAFLRSVREEFPDANHHVYAFRIGYGTSVIDGMSDDGEPTGTSGPPVLAVLRGSNLGDVIIVVTRYFGGTLLGTGGLTRAYSESARLGLDAVVVERKIQWAHIAFDMPYSLYQPIKRLLPQYDASITHEQFAAEISLFVKVPTSKKDALTATIVDLSAGTVAPIQLD